MTKTEKDSFDLLSDTAYLFRVIFCNAGFGTGKVLDNIEKDSISAIYDYKRGDYFEA